MRRADQGWSEKNGVVGRGKDGGKTKVGAIRIRAEEVKRIKVGAGKDGGR